MRRNSGSSKHHWVVDETYSKSLRLQVSPAVSEEGQTTLTYTCLPRRICSPALYHLVSRWNIPCNSPDARMGTTCTVDPLDCYVFSIRGSGIHIWYPTHLGIMSEAWEERSAPLKCDSICSCFSSSI